MLMRLPRRKELAARIPMLRSRSTAASRGIGPWIPVEPARAVEMRDASIMRLLAAKNCWKSGLSRSRYGRTAGDQAGSSVMRGFAAATGAGRQFPVRDEHGMKRGRRSFVSNPVRKDADLQGVYGSDGTRTRDLRRDRPVLVVPGSPGVGGDYRRERGFSAMALRGLSGAGGSFRRPPAGCARDAIFV